jgi:hypothetical protein
MILSHLNYLAVLMSTLAYFAVGSLWFSVLFGKPWMQGHNITMPDDETAKAQMKKEMPMMMIKTFVLCFVSTLAMAYLQVASCSFNWMAGAKIGIMSGVFVFVATAQSHMYTRKTFKLTLIDAGYHIVGLLIAGIILSVWR